MARGFFVWLAAFGLAGAPPGVAPRFEDYPAAAEWDGIRAPLKLSTPAARLFRTRLLQASREKPNFASHYRVAIWGCGSNCISGAIVDLASGEVLPPPTAIKGSDAVLNFSFCQSAFDGSGVEFRPDSRLMVVRCGLNVDPRSERNRPAAYYYVWDDTVFRRAQ